MKNQRPETELLFRQVGEVRTVNATAHSDNAVIVLISAGALDFTEQFAEGRSGGFTLRPAWKDTTIEGPTVVTDAAHVELNRGVRGIHYAVRAGLNRRDHFVQVWRGLQRERS